MSQELEVKNHNNDIIKSKNDDIKNNQDREVPDYLDDDTKNNQKNDRNTMGADNKNDDINDSSENNINEGINDSTNDSTIIDKTETIANDVKNQEETIAEINKFKEIAKDRITKLKTISDEHNKAVKKIEDNFSTLNKNFDSLLNDVSTVKTDLLAIKDEISNYQDLYEEIALVKAHSEYLANKIDKHTEEYLKIQVETNIVNKKVESSVSETNEFKEKTELQISQIEEKEAKVNSLESTMKYYNKKMGQVLMVALVAIIISIVCIGIILFR